MKAVVSFLVLFFVAVFVWVLGVPSAGAQQSPSWLGGSPSVMRDTISPTLLPANCNGFVQSSIVAELYSTRSLCVYGNSQLKIGTFQEGYARRAAVKFPFSDTFHELEGVCRGVLCVYSPSRDMIVTQQSIGRYSLGVVVYLNVSQRIKSVISPTGTARYVFDATNPDYEMTNEVGRFIWSPMFAVSENGNWIVAELRDSGLAIIDANTLTARHITTTGYKYGYGMDPSINLAISNDGKSVAQMGMNAGFSVISVDDDCGQVIVGSLSKLAGTRECISRDLPTGALFPSFRYAQQPRFYGSGAELEVVVLSWNEPTRKVTFSANGAQSAPRLGLLALGDSFTSGEGEIDESYYLNGTNGELDNCHLSRRSYPLLVASMLNLEVNDARTVACAGARIGDLMGQSSSYSGQGNRLGESGMDMSVVDKTIAQQQALDSFQPGWALQSDFVERYRPEKLLIGIGGNDAGLMGKLAVCAMPGTCEWATSEGIRVTVGEISRLKNALERLYATISQRFLDTQVFAVGYPNIISVDGECDPLTGMLFDKTERSFIKSGISALNQVIQGAADTAGIAYVDVENSFVGRNLCGSVDQSAMNTVRFGGDSSVISSLPMLKIIGSGTFHPTPIGHALVAKRILDQYPDLEIAPGCGGQVSFCANSGDSSLPTEWTIDTPLSDLQAYHGDFTLKLREDNDSNRKFLISIPRGSFQAMSSVRIEIRSDNVEIATPQTDAEGALTATIAVPDKIIDGFHTLHILGRNNEGRSIDVYQFLSIGQTDEALVTTPEEPLIDPSPAPIATTSGGLNILGGKVSYGGSNSNLSTSMSDIDYATNVLGLDTIATQSSILTPKIEKISDTKQDYINKSAVKVSVYIIGMLILILVLLGVILQRRWAKHHS